MIQTAIYGYGNLGRAVRQCLQKTPDMRLCGIYTRRAARLAADDEGPFWPPQALDAPPQAPDVIINCGGSAVELPRTTPALAARFCVVDSFDTHPAIPEHVATVDTAARAAGTLCVVSAGWDPGLFSLARLLGSAFLSDARCATFWGPGVSQGHSDALRRLPGVADARQYTIPQPQALADARLGRPSPATACHKRVCYIVPTPGADLPALEGAVHNMPNYFAGYETEVHFITAAELAAHHSRLPHGGSVICTGAAASEALSSGCVPRPTENAAHPAEGAPPPPDCDPLPTGREALPSGDETHPIDRLRMELTLALDSNPAFTAGVLVACARAAVRLHRAGQSGCRTMLELPPALYAPEDTASLRAKWM